MTEHTLGATVGLVLIDPQPVTRSLNPREEIWREESFGAWNPKSHGGLYTIGFHNLGATDVMVGEFEKVQRLSTRQRLDSLRECVEYNHESPTMVAFGCTSVYAFVETICFPLSGGDILYRPT